MKVPKAGGAMFFCKQMTWEYWLQNNYISITEMIPFTYMNYILPLLLTIKSHWFIWSNDNKKSLVYFVKWQNSLVWSNDNKQSLVYLVRCQQTLVYLVRCQQTLVYLVRYQQTLVYLEKWHNISDFFFQVQNVSMFSVTSHCKCLGQCYLWQMAMFCLNKLTNIQVFLYILTFKTYKTNLYF